MWIVNIAPNTKTSDVHMWDVGFWLLVRNRFLVTGYEPFWFAALLTVSKILHRNAGNKGPCFAVMVLWCYTVILLWCYLLSRVGDILGAICDKKQEKETRGKRGAALSSKNDEKLPVSFVSSSGVHLLRADFLNAVYFRRGLTCTLGLTNDLIDGGHPRAKPHLRKTKPNSRF